MEPIKQTNINQTFTKMVILTENKTIIITSSSCKYFSNFSFRIVITLSIAITYSFLELNAMLIRCLFSLISYLDFSVISKINRSYHVIAVGTKKMAKSNSF